MDVDRPHRRFNPLSGRWVLVSPHRATRPWLGQIDDGDTESRVAFDPVCYLCPGNERAVGTRNPAYDGVYVFDNDFPALTNAAHTGGEPAHPLFQAEESRGVCRVICFSPDHARTLPELTDLERRAIVDVWAAQNEELGRDFAWVQIFENKGAMMGCSNPHPHGQVWATSHVPDEAASEDAMQRDWFDRHGRAMLTEVAEQESGGEREVASNDDWIVIVPWWAAWPFETLLLPRFPIQRIEQATGSQRDRLAAILGELTARYDNLFRCSFPYSMGWHGAPPGAGGAPHWQLHAHFYPPLLRSATVKKFMVGYEMMAEPQRDMTPEQAAGRLREAGAVHFRAVL
jgi:UDPglucose--hexose-1-phosphate uridylyltransferase